MKPDVLFVVQCSRWSYQMEKEVMTDISSHSALNFYF